MSESWKPPVLAPRVVCWFSCGVTSAVASHLALKKYGHDLVVIAYTDTSSEHPDSLRFLSDCEQWFDHPIVRLHSAEYEDIWDVFERTGWLVGPAGARCTTELKKNCRRDFQRPDDIHVFGYDYGELDRIEKFVANNHDIRIELPLVKAKLTKEACADIVMRQGIEIPMMYRLGYPNNNCIGCVKGQQGYWNKIRVDFPEVFERMAKLERKMNVAINKTYDAKVLDENGKPVRQRVFLDELDPEAGNMASEPEFKCGLSCGVQEELF